MRPFAATQAVLVSSGVRHPPDNGTNSFHVRCNGVHSCAELRTLWLGRIFAYGPGDLPPSPERRSATRPREGQIRVCPRCGGTLRFSERTLWLRAPGVLEPAWACDNSACGHYDFVRRGEPSDGGKTRPST
jgi:hypothetical protein